MKAAFIIARLSEYRVFGPVIDRALQSGWCVECWHHYGRPRQGPKAYLFPTIDGVPHFQHGRPAVRTFTTADELVSWLETGAVDAVVSDLVTDVWTAHATIAPPKESP